MHFEKELTLKVLVRDNNVDQALRVLKKKLQRDGLFREIKRRKAYEKPSERKSREKTEAIRRGRKAARKLAQREGLLPSPRIKRRIRTVIRVTIRTSLFRYGRRGFQSIC